jgi:hypothetical protein
MTLIEGMRGLIRWMRDSASPPGESCLAKCISRFPAAAPPGKNPRFSSSSTAIPVSPAVELLENRLGYCSALACDKDTEEHETNGNALAQAWHLPRPNITCQYIRDLYDESL